MDIEDFLEVLRKIVVCSLGLLALCVTNYGWTELLSFVHTVSIYSMSLPRFIAFKIPSGNSRLFNSRDESV